MKTFVIGDVHARRSQLDALLNLIPFDEKEDTLVFLGDLVDRGEDAPGVVEDVIALHKKNPERVICLRGNHEQMLLNCVELGHGLWFTSAAGGFSTFEQYTNTPFNINNGDEYEAALKLISEKIPQEHLDFFRSCPLFYEDDYALYVHAGLENGKHPKDCDETVLMWSRNTDFFKNYRGKPCIFGHTPTIFLPFLGRIGRHGIYISHNAIGIDTGHDGYSPLTCLQLPDFYLYQTFPDGHNETHHITTFISEPLKAMQKTVSV
jgi:serine/threonine protein phosphatase 1